MEVAYLEIVMDYLAYNSGKYSALVTKLRPVLIVTGPDPDTISGFFRWSRLVKSYCTIHREYTIGPHLRKK